MVLRFDRQCQMKSVTDFAESFNFEVEDESLEYGSAVNKYSFFNTIT